MFNIVIVIISALIPVGLIILYFLINRSLSRPIEKEDKAGSEGNADAERKLEE